MKLYVVFTFLIGFFVVSHGQGMMKCGIKTCLIELFNFNDISFRTILKKAHAVSFCVKQCSPPGMTEFLQSLSFAFTKQIPGTCMGSECIDENRFVGLGSCFQNNSWPLVKCGVKLADLMQVKSEANLDGDQRNKTCDILVDSIRCVETIMAKCGRKIHSLMQEGIIDAVEVVINIYCRRSYKDGGSPVTVPEETTTPFYNDTGATHVPIAKGYKSRRSGKNAAPVPHIPASWVVASVICVIVTFGMSYS